MKSVIFRTICFLSFLSLLPGVAAAELSVTNKWRIEEAARHCTATGHELVYAEYWGDTVTDESRETTCIAEQFANLVIFEGDEWLDDKAPAFIKECREKAERDNKKYSSCLQTGLKALLQKLTFSC